MKKGVILIKWPRLDSPNCGDDPFFHSLSHTESKILAAHPSVCECVNQTVPASRLALTRTHRYVRHMLVLPPGRTDLTNVTR